jgi:shikimate kinase
LETLCIEDLECDRALQVVVATGGGLPAIPGMMRRLHALGATVYLKASVDELWKRLTMDPRELRDRPLLQTDGRRTLESLLESRKELYQQATITLDTGSLSVSEVCRLLVAHIDTD